MKKNFKAYFAIWLIFFVAFNLIVFLVQPVIPEYPTKYDARFWIAWVFIVIAFVGNLVCAYYAFKAENARKMFYNLPLLTVTWSALIMMLIAGVILMLIPNYPMWIAAVICIVILAFNAVAVVKAVWAADVVDKIDEKVKVKTSFIKNLTVDTDSILARAKSDTVKAECKKVYEAVKYSDPMSGEELISVESEISEKMGEFSSAVNMDDAERVKDIANELDTLLSDRNKKCKLLKG